MRKRLLFGFGVAATVASLFSWANWPGAAALPRGTRADLVVVRKSIRRLDLMREGEVLRSYRVSLGSRPVGHKGRKGDGRTPEGRYTIDSRKASSDYHFALHVNYPSPDDRRAAAARGLNPGGDIMIHGLGNGFGFVGRFHRLMDWTHGCIAVTNPEIEEIGRVVQNNTPVLILP